MRARFELQLFSLSLWSQGSVLLVRVLGSSYRNARPGCFVLNTCACFAGSAGSVPNEASHGSEQFSLQRIASTMEIIDPRDITLVKFLGSGGYGEVHLGKWHSSEAAIKCLNPSLFFQVMR